MNVTPTPIKRPGGVGVDHLAHHQRDCVRQAEAVVVSLQHRGVTGDDGADRDRLTAGTAQLKPSSAAPTPPPQPCG